MGSERIAQRGSAQWTRQVNRLFNAGVVGTMTDSQLLEQVVVGDLGRR